MRWLDSPSVRRGLRVGGVIAGCFLWAMVVMGLSFAMVEKGARQWWVVPVFGVAVLAIAVHGVRRLAPAVAEPAPARAVPPASRVLAESLSPREADVLRHLATGRSNREIARALYVAPGTVKAHLNHIFRKLGATTRLEAVAHAREAGLLE